MSVYTMKDFAVEPDKIPTAPHLAIVVFEPYSHSIPGDERSRTNPGHGYPAHTVRGMTASYFVFPDRANWEKALMQLHKENLDRHHADKIIFYGFDICGVAKMTTKVDLEMER